MSAILDLASGVVAQSKALGADEVAVSVAESSHITIQRRDGKVEQATEATTRGLTISILKDDRYVSSSTSDLRPDALADFLKRAVSAADWLEPEPERRFAPAEACGRAISDAELEMDDPAYLSRTATDRSQAAEALEQALRERYQPDVISGAVYAADGRTHSVIVMSHGFADESSEAWFAAGGELTLDEGEKRPESGAWFVSRYLSDLPSDATITDEVVRRTRERLGAGPIASGSYPMLVPGHAAGRILGLIGGPISAGSIHQGRSCMSEAKGTQIGSKHFTIIDDPFVKRGLASRAFDGDALKAKRFAVVQDGVLQDFYVSQYYANKLGWQPTTGGRSNWVVPPGDKSFRELAKGLPRAIEVNGFLGGNSNPATGDFSLGIRGVLWENGEPTKSLAEMNISGNIKQLFHQLSAVGNDPWMYGGVRSPTLLFDDIAFSGT